MKEENKYEESSSIDRYRSDGTYLEQVSVFYDQGCVIDTRNEIEDVLQRNYQSFR